MSHARQRAAFACVFVICGAVIIGAQKETTEQPLPVPAESTQFAPEKFVQNLRAGLVQVAIRLPWAAVLGAALALRPRRNGSPPRDPGVIETQIVLAIVGALIMLVVGASLARAFGIAGAANLIRYRAKIEDPKDAVVMLCALAVGLASGVGLFGIATAATFFIALTLWIIEGFENRERTFSLTVKLGDRTPERRGDIERLLRRARTRFELRSTADDALSYLVNAGNSLNTDRVSEALRLLATEKGKAFVEWKEETKARPLPTKDAA